LKLAIDSSQRAGSIALCNEDGLLYSAYFNISVTHSETLMPVMDYAMKLCGYNPQDIDEIFVCLGPGSFTGLRIGIATAKGIAYARGTRVLGYSSLQMAALPCLVSGKKILSVIDAKMKELYVAGFTQTLQPIIAPQVVSFPELLAWDIQDYILSGSGATLAAEAFKKNDITVAIAPNYFHQLRAEWLFDLPDYIAPNIYEGQSLANLEPLYLRESTAQLRKKKASI
jgi:tRNA threonylcarbamoyladenosine biosynthesis protein TsaB